MGFGGGALFASPFSTELLKKFDALITPPAKGAAPLSEPSSTRQDGIAKTFIVMALFYAVFMAMSYLLIRVPAAGLVAGQGGAAGGPAAAVQGQRVGGQRDQDPAVLAALGRAVLQRHGGHRHPGAGRRRSSRTSSPATGAAAALAAAAAGFVAILSLSNALGRILWSSTSDYLGRKNMYRIYLGVGALLYLIMLAHHGRATRRCSWSCCILILSFYGAGFATVPAYLQGPVRHLPGRRDPRSPAHRVVDRPACSVRSSSTTSPTSGSPTARPGRTSTPRRSSIVIGLLVIAFVCNELIKPVDPKCHEPEAVVQAAEVGAAVSAQGGDTGPEDSGKVGSTS